MAIEIVEQPDPAGWTGRRACPVCLTVFTLDGTDLVRWYEIGKVEVARVLCPTCKRPAVYTKDQLPEWLWVRLRQDAPFSGWD
jgi:hypothetical protein